MESNKLKDEIRTIMEIYLSAQESFKVVEAIYKKEDNSLTQIAKSRNFFLRYVAIIAWKHTVTELVKLFKQSKNERYNLHDFIKKLRSGEFPEAVINEEVIDRWEKAIEKEQIAIVNLKDQRDKLYSHTDSNAKNVANKISLTKTRELLKIVFGVIEDIYHHCFQSTILPEPTNSPLDDFPLILDGLANREKYYDLYEKLLNSGKL